jgi:hypothetical protein
MEGQGDLQSKITAISEQLLGGEATPQDERREDEVLEGEATSPEGDSAIDAEGADTPAGENPAAEEIRTIAELAKVLEVEPEFLYGLEFNLGEMGPDGQPVGIKLGELKDKLQNYERSRGEIEQQREKLTHERQQLMQQARELFTGGQRLQQEMVDARARIQALVSQRDSIDWKEFERLDPGRAALERQRYSELLNEAGANYQRVQYTLAQQSQTVEAGYRQAQDQELLKAIPEWRNREVALKEANAIGEWAARKYGYTPNDLAYAVDWQHRDILRKAYLYDSLQAKTAETQQHVRQAPRVLKPGSGLPRAQLQTQKLTALKEQAQRTGKKSDQLAAARAILDRAFANQRTR